MTEQKQDSHYRFLVYGLLKWLGTLLLQKFFWTPCSQPNDRLNHY